MSKIVQKIKNLESIKELNVISIKESIEFPKLGVSSSLRGVCCHVLNRSYTTIFPFFIGESYQGKRKESDN